MTDLEGSVLQRCELQRCEPDDRVWRGAGSGAGRKLALESIDKSQTFASYATPSARATIPPREIDGRRETSRMSCLLPPPSSAFATSTSSFSPPFTDQVRFRLQSPRRVYMYNVKPPCY
jgi:hypothetical protein